MSIGCICSLDVFGSGRVQVTHYAQCSRSLDARHGLELGRCETLLLSEFSIHNGTKGTLQVVRRKGHTMSHLVAVVNTLRNISSFSIPTGGGGGRVSHICSSAHALPLFVFSWFENCWRIWRLESFTPRMLGACPDSTRLLGKFP